MADRRRTAGWQRAAIAACAAVASLAAAPAASAKSREIMIILDASVAMQQPLETDTRMSAAIGAVGRALELHGKRNRIGVVAFGHRRSRSCEDVETIKGPRGVLDERVARVLAEMKPQGPAPIAKALEYAVSASDAKGGAARIVLIAAGSDTCEADPCTMARLLRDTRPVRIDVIAIGSGEQSGFRPLKCVARRTGGTFTAVGTVAELASALSSTVTTLASARIEEQQEEGGADAGAGWATEATAADPGLAGVGGIAPGASAFGEGAMQADALAAFAAGRATSPVAMTALLADPGPQLTAGLAWRIYEPPATSETEPRLIASLKEAAPTVALPAGEFLVNVAYGRANLTRRIKVEEGVPLAEPFVLNAGGLRLAARQAGGGEIPAQSVTFDIYSDERDNRGDRMPVLRNAQAGIIVRLNAGLYHLISTYGNVNAAVAADISVEAGKLSEVVVEHPGAPVSFRLVLQRGGEALADVTWRLYSPEGEIIHESAGALPTHVLAPGRYTVEATRGGEKFAEPLVVEPGKARQLEIVVTR